MPAAAWQVGIELRHEGRDHAALGAELLEVGLGAHGAVGRGERRGMGQRELDSAVTQLRVHRDHRRPHLLHALHEGLEHGAERRQAHQAVGIPPARDRREHPRRERRGVFVHVVDEDLVLEREARLETHLGGLVRSAPEHRARAFRRQGAVGVVDIEDGRHRVRPPGQAADGGGVRFPVNVSEAVLVGRERREINIVRRGQPVDDVRPADLVREALVECEKLAAQPAVQLRRLDLDETDTFGAHLLAHRRQSLVRRSTHCVAPTPTSAGFS